MVIARNYDALLLVLGPALQVAEGFASVIAPELPIQAFVETPLPHVAGTKNCTIKALHVAGAKGTHDPEDTVQHRLHSIIRRIRARPTQETFVKDRRLALEGTAHFADPFIALD